MMTAGNDSTPRWASIPARMRLASPSTVASRNKGDEPVLGQELFEGHRSAMGPCFDGRPIAPYPREAPLPHSARTNIDSPTHSGGFDVAISRPTILSTRPGPAALLCLPLVSLAAQSGTIQGQVVDSAGAPIVGAIVTVDRTSLGTTTTASGRYTIHGVPARLVTVTVHAIGFAEAASSVTVVEADVVALNFTMNRSPVELAPIDVVVGSRARHTAAEELAVPVDVYTAEDIQQQGTTETSQVLQTLSPR